MYASRIVEMRDGGGPVRPAAAPVHRRAVPLGAQARRHRRAAGRRSPAPCRTPRVSRPAASSTPAARRTRELAKTRRRPDDRRSRSRSGGERFRVLKRCQADEPLLREVQPQPLGRVPPVEIRPAPDHDAALDHRREVVPTSSTAARRSLPSTSDRQEARRSDAE